MTPKLRRWIDLLAGLLRRQYPVAFEELTRDVPGYQNPTQSFETRRRMFERDKQELRSFGIPIETRDLGEGELGYRLARDHFYMPYLQLLRKGRTSTPKHPARYGYRSLPYLTFEPDELTAVLQAAKRVETLGIPSLTDHARSALRKLGHDLRLDETNADDGVHRLHRAARADEETFSGLSDALARRKRVTIAYHSMDRDTVSDRTVHPYGLFFLGHHWYLAAAEPGESTVKNYRLTRVRRLVVNSASSGTPDYEIPKSFSLKQHATAKQAWELGAGESEEAIVRVTGEADAALVAAKLGAAVPGDPTARRFRVRRLDAFSRWILGAAGAVLPVAPPELVVHYRNQVAATSRLYAECRE